MKIIGMIPVYNDEDIIEEVIDHYISQGLELVILDNGSTDGSYKKCKKYLNSGVLDIIQFKNEETFTHNWPRILRMLYDMALVHSPDWVIRSDSDEFLESGVSNLTLKEAIEKVDSEGNNLIQFDRFDFFMTDNDNKEEQSIRGKMPYYSCYGDFLYRSWKYSPGINVELFGGHCPVFLENHRYKIHPKKFVLRHYSLRNKEHAEKKLKGRMKGMKENKKTKPELGPEIRKIKRQSIEPVDHTLLTKYSKDNNWNYDLKYCPLLSEPPAKKSDLFTDEGFLKNKFKTNFELILELGELKNKTIYSILRKRIKKLRNKI